MKHREKRAITFEEHQKIIAREFNLAARTFYEFLWHLGGAQSDIATLTAEDIDWKDRTISYQRHKIGAISLISFGDEVAGILKNLPTAGELFPALARTHERHRAKMFIKRLKTVGIRQVKHLDAIWFACAVNVVRPAARRLHVDCARFVKVGCA